MTVQSGAGVIPDSAAISEWLADALIDEAVERREANGQIRHWVPATAIQDSRLVDAYELEIDRFIRAGHSKLAAQAREVSKLRDEPERYSRARRRLVERLDQELRQDEHVRQLIRALRDAESAVGSPPEPVAGPRPLRRLAEQFSRVIFPLFLLNAIVLGIMLVGHALHLIFDTAPPNGDPLQLTLLAGAAWALSFMPGWLYVRFLDRRVGALWTEYVIHLHRLGVDNHENLPEPPSSSAYHKEWIERGGTTRKSEENNLYRQKFDAYFGNGASQWGESKNVSMKSEALFPVFLVTGLLAAGWTAVFYDVSRTFAGGDPASLGAALSFGFLGAYLFFIQMLLRRFFQADLRAGSYVSGYVRIVSALIVVAVLYAALPELSAAVMVAVAFAVGWFPSVGLQWLLRVGSRPLHGAVPSLDPAYPLNRLDGLNVWYEARLLEEGIEDLQNLATAKIVDVLLHTRVPVARLVDWVDQALLLIHLPAEPSRSEQPLFHSGTRARRAASLARLHPRYYLRRCGIRSATALVRALEKDRPKQEREALTAFLEEQGGIDPAALLSLHAVIAADRRILTIFNWQEGDAHGPKQPPTKSLV